MFVHNNDPELYNLCEAVNCFERATQKIEVKAGTERVISLLLCNDCVSKFEESTN